MSVDVDLTNARVVEFRSNLYFGGKSVRFAYRKDKTSSEWVLPLGNDSYHLEDAIELGRVSDVRVLEEFPAPSLGEIVGNAPAFQATDGGIVRVWVKRDDGFWGAVNLRGDYGSPVIDPYPRITCLLEEIEEFIDIDTVAPLTYEEPEEF